MYINIFSEKTVMEIQVQINKTIKTKKKQQKNTQQNTRLTALKMSKIRTPHRKLGVNPGSREW
jgi:hypothetical protein